jgi:uncharacterized protein (DUF58 family)
MPSRFAIALLLTGCLAALLAGGMPWGWAILLLLDAVVVGLFLLDARLAGRLARRLRAERMHGTIVSAGRTQEVTLRLSNPSGRKIRARLVDALPEAVLPDQALFPGLVLGAGRDLTLSYRFTALRRGSWSVGPAVARVLGPLGLAWSQAEIVPPSRVKVYPDIKLIERYQNFLRRSRLRDYGISPAACPGQGTEFESLREFVEGDDPSKIAWKATARKGKLIVRNFQEERSQTVMLLVDSGKMMTTIIEGRSRLDYAVDSALLLGHVILSKGDHAGLLLFSEKVRKFLPPAKDAGQIKRIADALHDADASLIEPDYLRAIRLAASRRRRSLIILFTDIWGKETAAELVACLRNVVPMHLPLVVMMRDRDMEAIAAGLSGDGGEHELPFAMAAAGQLLHERSETIAQLRSMGALVLDVYPGQLTAGAIRKYLEVKARNLI